MELSNKYNFYRLRKLSLYLVILGGINYGTKLFNIDLLEFLGNKVGVNKNIIYVLITIAVIFILFVDTNLWTPFLGNVVLPCAVINKSPPNNSNTFVTIKTKPFKKIVYWASLENTNNKIVWESYGDYSNSGVVSADKNGKAVLKFRKPSSYTLPDDSKLSPHVHYRECPDADDAEAMLGPLKTVYL